jgi:phosphoserine phosphatase RsbU/P
VQAAVRAFTSETASPSYVCGKINSVLCSNIAPGKFVTLFYAVLDSRSRTLRYANAGHLPPILGDSHGKVRHLENGGALLGVFPDWRYVDSEVKLKPGDLLLMFTDGITEAMAPNGEEFGENRLIAAATRLPEQSLDDLLAQVLERVGRFCDFRLNDDATLILIAASQPTVESVDQNTHDRDLECTGAKP